MTAASAGAVLAALSLAGCTTARSVEAYCHTVQEHKTRYLSAMNKASSQNALVGLLSSAAAIGDLKSMWSDLAKVAPSDIQTDTETVRDAWSKIADDANDRNFFGALAVSLENAAPMQRVDQYIAKHCGVDAAPVGVASRAATSAATPSPTPTPALPAGAIQVPNNAESWAALGPMLWVDSSSGDSIDDGTEVFLPNGAGDVRLDSSKILADADVKSATFAAAGTKADAMVVMLSQSRLPAHGLDPESYVTQLTALRWSDLSVITTSDLFSSASKDDGPTAIVGSSSSVVAVALNRGGKPKVVGVDASTGRTLWSEPGALTTGTVDTAIISAETSGENGNYQPCLAYTGVDVATGNRVWRFSENSYKEDGYCPDLQPDVTNGQWAAAAAVHAPVQFVNLYGENTGGYRDLHTGAALHVVGKAQKVDPITGYEWRDQDPDDDNGSSTVHDASVIDTATGSAKFSMSDTRASQLGLTVDSFYDGRLYAQTTDSDLVIDAEGGDVLGYTSIRPTAPVGAFTFWSDGLLTTTTTRSDTVTPSPSPSPSPTG